MKRFLYSFIFFSIFLSAKAQTAEDRIKNYLGGYEMKDWNMTSSQLAEGFNFTSPAGDNHITLEQYKEKCWPTNKFFKKIEFSKILVDGNTAFAIYDITTTDNKVVHNVEYYTFSNGKIKSVECFFGAGLGYPGNSANAK
jgi:hypothetical protein